MTNKKDIPEGSLETGLRGQYQIPIGRVFAEAWSNVWGLKGPMVAGQIYVFCLLIICSLLGGLVVVVLTGLSGGILGLPLNIILNICIGCFAVSLFGYLNIMTIKNLCGLNVTSKGVFKSFGRAKKVFWIGLLYMVVLFVIQIVLVIFGVLLFFMKGYNIQEFKNMTPDPLFFITFGVLLFIGVLVQSFAATIFYLSLPVALDRDIKATKAANILLNTFKHQWWRIIVINLICLLIMFLSLLTIGIAFIWTAPWIFSTNAVILKRSIGIKTLGSAE